MAAIIAGPVVGLFVGGAVSPFHLLLVSQRGRTWLLDSGIYDCVCREIYNENRCD